MKEEILNILNMQDILNKYGIKIILQVCEYMKKVFTVLVVIEQVI